VFKRKFPAIAPKGLMKAKTLAALVGALAATAMPIQTVMAEELLVQSSLATATDVINWKGTQLPVKPKVGLALGGGGARGSAEIGVMEVLEKEGIPIDVITGTSIGSIVGGLYTAGVPVETLRHEFETGRALKHFMPVSLPVGIALEPLMFCARLVGFHSYDGLYPGYVFRKYLEKLTPENTADIQQLKRPFAAVSLNLVDGKPYMIRGGSLVKAMRASSAVPGLRKPVAFAEKLMVDGGVACNVPVKQCRELGANIVIAVNIDQPFAVVERDKFRKAGSVSKRLVNWDLYCIDKPQEDLADVVIHPDTSDISLVTANKKDARRAIEAGRVAAQAALPLIREKLRGMYTAKEQNSSSATTAIDTVTSK
jgi:NTE family protein